MPPAHCGVAYLAYRTLLTNGAIHSTAEAAAAAFGIRNGRDWPCKAKATCVCQGSWSTLDRTGLSRSGLGTLLVCISNFALFYEGGGGFKSVSKQSCNPLGGPATRSGKAMFGSPLGGTNPSPHKRRLN